MDKDDDHYNNGVRDQRLNGHDKDIKKIKETQETTQHKLSILSAWQNKAIGYATAIATVVTLAIQYIMRKYL